MLRAAVVGLGVGHAHCAAYLSSSHATLAAVCDVWPQRLERVDGTFRQGSMLDMRPLYPPDVLDKRWEDLGVKVYTSLDELLEDPSIDLVSLCTPDYTHGRLALRVLRSGRHLLLEKPVALDLADAEAIGEELDRSGVRFTVNYEFRLNPAVAKLREVAAGFTGAVQAFTLYHFRRPFRRDKWKGWIQKRELSGGLIVEETCHWFDLLRFITLEEPRRMDSRITSGIHPDSDFEDIAFIQGELSGGGIFQISHALSGFDFSLTLTVHGRSGTAWCSLKDQPSSRLDDGETSYCALVAWGSPNEPPERARLVTFGPEAMEPQSIKTFVAHFAHCVATGAKPPVSFQDAYRALELSLEARTIGEQSR